jgi:hypothetical protein
VEKHSHNKTSVDVQKWTCFVCLGNYLTSHADSAKGIPCYGGKYGSRHGAFWL